MIEDANRINWIEKARASLVFHSQPDMENKQWYLSVSDQQTRTLLRRQRYRTVREAIDAGIRAWPEAYLL